MLVRIVKDWSYPETFFGQTHNADGVWGEVKFTEEPVDKCDYLIVLQRPPYDIHVRCPNGNAWLITQEPPVDYFSFFKRSFKYFDRVYSYFNDPSHQFQKSLQPVLPWHLLKSYVELSNLKKSDLEKKTDDVAWITSNKKGFPGQKARMAFLQRLRLSAVKYHLYGRGFKPINDKFDGLFPCKYALAIENFSVNHYWTEKAADSFLSWCLPFYWGAPNLEDYFPSASFIRIDVNRPAEAIAIILKAIENNEWEKRLAAIEKARELVLNQYQFFPYISQMIVADAANRKETTMKQYFIPANPYPRSYKIINQMKYYFKRAISLVSGQTRS
jgi:hypothetical protein